MPSSSTGSSSPTSSASLRRLRQRRGDRVEGEHEVLPRGVEHLLALSGLSVTASMPSLVSDLASLGVALDEVDGGGQALDDPLHDVGVLLEERGADDEVGGDVLAVGPEVAPRRRARGRRPPG